MIMHRNRSAEVRVPDGRVQEIRMLTQFGWMKRSQMRVVKVRQLHALEGDILRHGSCKIEAASVVVKGAIYYIKLLRTTAR